MEFPIYRKYKGIDVWFKIISLNEFIEIKKMGNKILKTEVKAEIYPEKLFIKDMIDCHENRWVEIDEKEYFRAEKLF